jgi:hypothetical protein
MVRIWGDLEVGIRNDDLKTSGYTRVYGVYPLITLITPGLHQCLEKHTIGWLS